jgi:hypothetical protein
MTFKATLGGKAVVVLLDSGASANFVTATAARSANAGMEKVRNKAVQGAGGEINIKGSTKPRLVMQAHHSSPLLNVLDSLPGPFDVVLGNTWLREHHANLNFAAGTCSLSRTQPVVLLTADCDPGALIDSSEPRESGNQDPMPSFPPVKTTLGEVLTAKQPLRRAFTETLLTALQFKRVSRKASRVFCVLVTDKALEEKEQTKVPANVQAVVDKYSDVFAEIPRGLPPVREGVSHTIPLVEGAQPPHRRMYRLSPRERDEVEKQVKELLEKEWIEPSTSPYGAPVIFAQKKDGTLRMCVDYRALNSITVKNRYPLPRIDDLLDRLYGATVFSSLDLQMGYHQIRITDADVNKTAFVTHKGLYQYRVLCFGVSNAPSTFQSVMNRALAPVLDKTAMVYMDDILVFSKNPDDHARHLEEVLQLLREAKLYAKLSKCSFAQQETNFLGHVISKEGIKVDPRKIKVIVDWPQPTTPEHLRSFLGLATYYRKFCEHFSSKAHELHQLLRKNVPFDWTALHTDTFNTIKQAMASAPILSSPNLEPGAPPFHVICDASGVGLGALLEQDGHPCAYESRKLLPAERNYGVGEQELLAVVHAMRTWRCYLEGVKSVVVTDHNPNTYLQTVPTLSRRQVRWSEYLQNFDFEWQYREGKSNPADALSRMPQYQCLLLYPKARRQCMQAKDEIPSVPDESFVLLAMTRAAERRIGSGIIPHVPRSARQEPSKPREERTVRVNPYRAARKQTTPVPPVARAKCPPGGPAQAKRTRVEPPVSTDIGCVDPITDPVRPAKAARVTPQVTSAAQAVRVTRKAEPVTLSSEPCVVPTIDLTAPTSVTPQDVPVTPTGGNLGTPVVEPVDQTDLTRGTLSGNEPVAPRVTRVNPPRRARQPQAVATPRVPPVEETGTTSNLEHEPLTTTTVLHRCKKGYEKDAWFSEPAHVKDFDLTDGVYHNAHRLVVPNVGNLRQDIIAEEHDTRYAGHGGVGRTEERVRRQFWWPSLRKDVTNFVTTCHACQRNKVSRLRPAGLLRSLDIPAGRWTDVSMDFITHLPPTSAGNTQIVIYVCRLTKMVHMDALPKDATAADVAENFMHNVFRLHGLPANMVSDRDSKFTSHFWKELMRLLGPTVNLSSAFHPKSDGQTERTNQVLEDMLRQWVGPEQADWDKLLDCAEFAMNNSVNRSVHNTPFRLNYGQDPLTPLSIHANTRLPVVRSFIQTLEQALASAKICMQAANDRSKAYYDQGRRPQEFHVGQKVLLKTVNLTVRGPETKARKLVPKWFGPFPIVEKIGQNAYRIKLPTTLRVHDVFHTELLKAYREGDRVQPPPPPVEVDGDVEYVVEEILSQRVHKRGKREPTVDYLVKWRGYGQEHNSWEPESALIDVDALDRWLAKNQHLSDNVLGVMGMERRKRVYHRLALLRLKPL